MDAALPSPGGADAAASPAGGFPAHAPHRPVLLEETLAALRPAPGEVIVDATVGCGGHAQAVLGRLLPGGTLIGIDRDPAMLRAAREALAGFPRESWRLFEANYADLPDVLAAAGFAAADGILLDAGFCSAQMDDPERGFSYRADGPLDMRYGPDAETAERLVNTLEEAALARLFREFGEERWARRIARHVIAARREGPIRRTAELARIIERAVPAGRRRLHPARRCFQALRIAANRELDHLDRFLAVAPACLAPGGRLVCIAYHSLEDRRIKQAFARGAEAGEMLVEAPHVVRPGPAEVESNPRARSARLRSARRCTGGPRPRGAEGTRT